MNYMSENHVKHWRIRKLAIILGVIIVTKIVQGRLKTHIEKILFTLSLLPDPHVSLVTYSIHT